MATTSTSSLRFPALALLLLGGPAATAFAPGAATPRRCDVPRSSPSLSMAFDAAVAETVASAAALPAVFVGTGSYFLAAEGKEKEEEQTASSTGTDNDGEVDIYRDTLLRYAGYANEVGEAFAPLVPPVVVPASYGVAITYVVADTIDKTRKCLDGGTYDEGSINTCALVEGLDALIWQLAASVALPGFTIHQVVVIVVSLLTAAGLYGDGVESSALINALPTATGLACIPLIVKPLDELAEVGMDVTFRKLSKPYLESCKI